MIYLCHPICDKSITDSLVSLVEPVPGFLKQLHVAAVMSSQQKKHITVILHFTMSFLRTDCQHSAQCLTFPLQIHVCSAEWDGFEVSLYGLSPLRVCVYSKTGSHYVAQAGLKPTAILWLLPLPHTC